MKTIQKILRLESLVEIILIIGLYAYLHLSWILFAVLILVPDIAIVGYLRGNKMGAICYNILHSFILPLIILGLGLETNNVLALTVSLIWLAHITLDRAMGYGLKLQGFKDTHLGNIGKS